LYRVPLIGSTGAREIHQGSNAPTRPKQLTFEKEMTMLKRIHLIAASMLLALLFGLTGQASAQVNDFDLALARALSDQRANPGYLFDYREAGRSVDLDNGGGVVYARLYARQTGELVPGVIDLIVLTRDDGRWNVFLPGTYGYVDAQDRLPKAIRDGIDPSPYRLKADPAIDASLGLTDFQFPWGAGKWATVTRSFNTHGIGQVDFDVADRAVTAAKDGTIVYINDTNDISAYGAGGWWYWNVVVIQHSDHDYSLYGHLAPHSIPRSITQHCKNDLSRSNCAVPVKAGDVIGAEGTTGYSSNYHLHAEFGQSFGIIPYPDLLDGNHNGNRTDEIFAGFVYAEHNVGFQGYKPAEVADWKYGTLEQALGAPPPPMDRNLVSNGDFADGNSGWKPSGQINWNVTDGVMQVLRLKTDADPHWATFSQVLPYGTLAHQAFQVTLRLGNSANIRKSMTVSLLNSQGRDYGALTCNFDIPAGQSLATYTMRGLVAQSWGKVALEIGVNPADGAKYALVDDVDVRALPPGDLATQDCAGPT
jgi:murein DD-endopeptidase MepM/ murein hydrolase activator NlpD